MGLREWDRPSFRHRISFSSNTCTVAVFYFYDATFDEYRICFVSKTAVMWRMHFRQKIVDCSLMKPSLSGLFHAVDCTRSAFATFDEYKICFMSQSRTTVVISSILPSMQHMQPSSKDSRSPYNATFEKRFVSRDLLYE